MFDGVIDVGECCWQSERFVARERRPGGKNFIVAVIEEALFCFMSGLVADRRPWGKAFDVMTDFRACLSCP